MQEDELKKLRFTETKNFLLFQSKVLKNQKTRVIVENEEQAHWKISKNLQYELQKLLEFLKMNDLVKHEFSDQILEYEKLKLLLDVDSNLESTDFANEVFQTIEEIREQIKVKQL
ncbi:hypothetical protein MJH12_11420 [bacterium]|nr:hypothetical protein [bacterium]